MRSRIEDGYGGGTRRCSRASATLVLAAIVVLAGCYYRKYDKLLRTHVDVLTAMAGKIEDLTARDGVPPPSLGEYRYPLERARDFARIAARRFEGRPSLTAFRALCDAYERILAAAESVRGAPESAAGRSAFAAALTDFRARADATLGALRDERVAAARPPVLTSSVNSLTVERRDAPRRAALRGRSIARKPSGARFARQAGRFAR